MPPTSFRPSLRITHRSAAAVLAALTGVVLLATPAWAHDELLSTTPGSGQSVATVPAEVVLTFAEPPLELGMAVQVAGPDGTDLASGPPALAGSLVHQAIRAGAPAGRYTVRWRVTADDGHPVSGSFSFTALAAGGATAPATSAPVTTSVAGAGTTAVSDGTDSSSVLWWVAAAAVLVLGVALLAGTTVRRRSRPGGRDVREGALDD